MQIARYFLVGSVAAVTDLGIYAGLIYLMDWAYLSAGAISFIFSTYVNYSLSIRHVFEQSVRFSPKVEILMIYIVSGIGLANHQLILYGCVDELRMHEVSGKVAAMVVVFFWNFLIRKYYIFYEK